MTDLTRRAVGILACVFAVTTLRAGTYYVSATGDDANPGTIDNPFKTIVKGMVAAESPGDTVFIRGGIYPNSTPIVFFRNGLSLNMFHLFAFPGERPLVDFSSMAISGSNRGFELGASYWHIRGLDIFKAGDNGMHVSGSNNIIERCSFSENADTGLQLDNGASDNQVINCDSYYNADPGQGNADGFAPKLTVGSGNYFFGCRAWQNSDDGWDGYMRGANNVSTTLVNCWSFNNGYLKNGAASAGNGNGFKMGGSDNRDLEHNMILQNCLAFDNRVKGFDQNNNRGSMTLYNCTGYNNGTNYSISLALDSGKTLIVKNCVALGALGSLGSFAVQQTNSWMPPFVAAPPDFQSVDTAGVRGPRNPDGSLPMLAFMHLAVGSDLIDAGTNIGLPFKGTAPDLGCFETEGTSSVAKREEIPLSVTLEQNYPNPFNPVTTVRFTAGRTGRATLEVFNVAGELMRTLYDGEAERGRTYSVTFDGNDCPGGLYFYRLRTDTGAETRKFVLLK